MDRTPKTNDERLAELIIETTRLTGEEEVEAMCKGMEERLERLVPRRVPSRSGIQLFRLRLDVELSRDRVSR
jgi:hypothetical protein